MNKFFNQKVDNNKLKRELVISIQKNVECLDFLDNLEKHYEDIYNYSQNRSDEINVEKIKWIKFQISYNIDLFNKSLKNVGGYPNAIQFTEWK